MKFDNILHNRHSIRLKGHDYSSEGMYYVTLCVKDREYVLGEIVENEIRPTAMGEIVRESWENIPKHFKNAELDEYAVMPNHVHGIVILKESIVGTRHAVSQQEQPKQQEGPTAQKGVSPHAKVQRASQATEHFGKPVQGSLSTIMRSFKSAATKTYTLGRLCTIYLAIPFLRTYHP